MVFNKAHFCPAPPQGKMFQAKEIGREGPQISKSQRARPVSFTIFGFNWNQQIENNRLRKEPGAQNKNYLTHTGPAVTSDPHHPVDHSREKMTHGHVHSTPRLSYSKHKSVEIQDYRFEMGMQRRARNVEKNKGCHLCSENSREAQCSGWRGMILWARTSPSLIPPICCA